MCPDLLLLQFFFFFSLLFWYMKRVSAQLSTTLVPYTLLLPYHFSCPASSSFFSFSLLHMRSGFHTHTNTQLQNTFKPTHRHLDVVIVLSWSALEDTSHPEDSFWAVCLRRARWDTRAVSSYVRVFPHIRTHLHGHWTSSLTFVTVETNRAIRKRKP